MTRESVRLDPHTLMVQGTTSDAGKSALVTALCRLLARGGYQVAPFKSQNMALNSAVTDDGGEIGRAQAVQALAAGISLSTDLNPVLLKPTGECGSQVIVHGQVRGQMSAREYHEHKPALLREVTSAFQRLHAQHDFVMIEGAGSPAEINLRARDIANMGLAEAIHAPVILIADIDRGGVFAHLVGTLALLTSREREHVIGLVINRFRGDPALLEPGIRWLEERTDVPVLAVVPYVNQLHLEAEDSLSRAGSTAREHSDSVHVVIPTLPSLSNPTDFDPLRAHPNVRISFATHPRDVTQADLIILPGSKRTCFDLDWLHQQGWPACIERHLRYGGKVMGICGGYQMLGTLIDDPDGIEGPAGITHGLGYLRHSTVLSGEKTLHQAQVTATIAGHTFELTGYEIHVGDSTPCDTASGERPFARHSDGRYDGSLSEDEQVLGTYLHGVFDTPNALAALLQWAGLMFDSKPFDYEAFRLAEIDRLAETVGQSLRLERWPEGPLRDALQRALKTPWYHD